MHKISRYVWIPCLLVFVLGSAVLPSLLRAADNDGFSFNPTSLSMDAKQRFSIDYKNTVAGYALIDIKITITGDLKNLPLSIIKFSSKVASNHTGTAEFDLAMGRVKPGAYSGSVIFEGTISRGGKKRSGEVPVAIFVDGFIFNPLAVNVDLKVPALPTGRTKALELEVHFSNANPYNAINRASIAFDKASDLNKLNISLGTRDEVGGPSRTGSGVAYFRFVPDYAKFAGLTIKGSAIIEATVVKTKSIIKGDVPITIKFPPKPPTHRP